MEEFPEADVLWPEEDMRRRLAYDAPSQGRQYCSSGYLYGASGNAKEDAPSQGRQYCSSGYLYGASGNAKETAPITIPSPASAPTHHHRSWKLEFAHRGGDEGGGGDDKEMVPPHVLLARRRSGEMPFSVQTGQGRTLKGRDLSQVRNSILRLTGFLEG